MSNIKMPVPKVIIDKMALEKIKYFVAKDHQECSGMGITRIVGDTIYVDDIKMLEQKNGAAHTDINEAAVTKLMFDWREREGNLNFWWHSHVNMGVFWSGQDEATIKQLGQHGLCVASVFNKKGEIRTAVAAKIEVPFATGPQVVMFDDLTLMVHVPAIPDEITKAWDEEHKANVIVPVFERLDDYSRHNDWSKKNQATKFKFVQTKFPGWWDDFDQAKNYDIDWVDGVQYDRDHMAFPFSAKHLEAQNKWLAAQGAKTTNAVLADCELEKMYELEYEDYQKKVAFALAHADAIVDYDDGLDMFELESGLKVCANWYMREGPKALAYTGSKLDNDVTAYERDMAIRNGHDIPSEKEVEDMFDHFNPYGGAQ